MAKPFVASSMSRTAVIRRVIALFVLLLVAGSVAYPNPANAVIGAINGVTHWSIPSIRSPFVLGLDLQGGTRLEYSADVSKIPASEQKSALDGVRDVIERRVNTIGVSEPLVQTAKAGDEWRVSVELAGIRDINQAIKLIGETPLLEFKEQNTDPKRTLTAEERKKMEADNAAAAAAADAALQKALKEPTFFDATGTDLGFLRENPVYADVFEKLKTATSGMVYPSVISGPNGDLVAKVTETKGAGSEINAYHLLISFAGASNASSTFTKEQARAKIEEIKKQVTAKNFVELSKKYSMEPGASETGGALGWFGKGVMVESFETPAFALAVGQVSDVVESPFGYHLIYKEAERPLNDVRVRALEFKKLTEEEIIGPDQQWKNTQLSGKNLKRAQLDFDQRLGGAQVSLVFDDAGAELFAEITKRNIGKPVGIFLDGAPISVPTVNTEITGGQAVITGSFSVNEAKLLAQRLNAGALPVPINLIAQQSVGPTLGQNSVQASLIAGLWGLLFVALFMLVFYRLPGLLAIGTLGLYIAVSLAVYKLLPVTLTLSGIAGFILSMGIAVDANVLVFERLKEELRAGKALKPATEEAFKRAWTSIRDGNVTTLISCMTLYWFSSSVIKGFALTLAVGVLLSMFTAVVAARSVMRLVVGSSWAQKVLFLFPGSKTSDQKTNV